MTPFILIDGSSYFFRAFHALPPLTNSKGQPTGAIYGVANMIKRLIKDFQPQYIAVVFDAKGKTFRDEWYPEYKAHRPPMPNDLFVQFEPLNAILKAMGLPILSIEGVEADDVIGTLAKLAAAEGHEVLISTGDKDMAQLVNERVRLINTMSNHVLTIDNLKEKFGVDSHQLLDYFTLIGDSIDNIPGVTKCGPKTACKWLEEYKSLDNLIANAEKISGKIGENLRDSLQHLPLSKQLLTIKCDVELPLSLSDLKVQEHDEKTLVSLVRELEFKSWLKELLEQQAEAPHLSFSVVTNEPQMKALCTQLVSSSLFSIHLEKNSHEALHAELGSITFAGEDFIAQIPLRSNPGLEAHTIWLYLKDILENPEIKKISFNAKESYHLFNSVGITLRGAEFDVLLESYVLNSSSANQHTIESLSLKYLGIALSSAPKTGKTKSGVINKEECSRLAATCAHHLYKLHQVLYPLLAPPLKQVLHDIEIPLSAVLAQMEQVGVLIDEPALLKHGERLKKRIRELEDRAFILADQKFNLNSPKQLQEILYTQLKFPILEKTPTGQPSTAESVLQELAFDFELPGLILEHRSLSKLVSTYIDALPKRIHAKSLRVHTCYNQAIAATGRLSSSEPNLQNIPIRSEEGRLIRRAFIAPPGFKILAADYSQIELRIMAHLSGDTNLLKAFSLGWDVHAATASEIFQVELAAVTEEQRRRAKAVNFGLIYGMSSFGLAKQLGIDRKDAEFYMERYFKRYPAVLHFMDNIRRQAHKEGYVETIFGRRLYLPEINTRNLTRQRAAERMAINAPMQGTAADIIKKAMLAIYQWLKDQPIPVCNMIMQVHDELLFEVKETFLEEAKAKIAYLMENAAELSVPLQVSIGIGANWDEAH